MRFCQPHWEQLRTAIAERGLDHLVAKGGAQAARNLASELRDGPAIQSFDPLMVAHNAILMHAMDAVGLAALAPNDDGTDRCPQCFLNAEHERQCSGPPCTLPLKNAFDDWTAKAADMAKTQYEDLLAKARADA